jgi:hypothetical protein
MLYHASADEKKVPATGEFPLPEARYVYFLQGRLYRRLCQENCSESLGIEK